MALTIKREILNQLKLINGLNVSKQSLIKVIPINNDASMNMNKIGQSFQLNLNSNFSIQNNSLLKHLRNNTSLIENIEVLSSNNDNTSCKIEVDFETIVKYIFKDLHDESYLQKAFKNGLKEKKKIIVEYSSPNIAKPFHVGNLRSTIIGNCIANIFEFFGHDVIRINYLGDWGTQFGILSLAFDQYGDESKLQNEPLKHLFDCYVMGNKQCELNDEWRNQAKNRFYQLEHKSNNYVYKQWCHFRELSCNELNRLYDRLGIQFDHQESESMYNKQSINNLIEMLESRNLIETKEDNAKYAVVNDYSCSHELAKKISIPLLKKDGTSLYITRDVAAVLNRRERFNFDQIYYVVDNSQAKHFNNLKNIFFTLNDPVYKNMIHLRFGRILGMSTRKGQTIFLDDVLNEAKQRALNAIKESPNTKISTEQYDEIADILGVTAIIIHDLSNHRVSQYKFNWNHALKLRGNTGISLQYTHARLCNLIQKTLENIDPKDLFNDLNIGSLDNLDARNLINQILMFDETIDQCYEQLEPSILTHYLFRLKTAINCANQSLNIKQQNLSIQKTRLLLFICAKNILNQSMRLLGLRPLESM